MVFNKIISVCTMALLLCSLASCAAQPQQPKNSLNKILLSQVDSNHYWIDRFVYSFEYSSADNDYDLLYTEPNEHTAEWQISNILSVLSTDIEYLVLVPKDESVLDAILPLAQQMGVGTFIIGQEIDPKWDDYYIANIITDFELEGRLAATALVEEYNGEPCRIIELVGLQTSDMSIARSKGFHDVIKDHPNITIVETAYGNYDRVDAQNAIDQLIVNDIRDFEAVFAHSDEMGLGALRALKIADYAPGSGVDIFSINGIEDSLKAIIANEYTATVYSSYQIGPIVFSAIDILNRGYIPVRSVHMPTFIINDINAKTYMYQAGGLEL